MNEPQSEDSDRLASAVDRERLGRLVTSRHAAEHTSVRAKSSKVFLWLILIVAFLALIPVYLIFSVRNKQASNPSSRIRSISPPNSNRPFHTVTGAMVLI